MDSLQKALDFIAAQQEKLEEGGAPWCVGEQLADILRETPAAAEIVAADLEQSGMKLTDAEQKIAEFARRHRNGNAGFCGPKDADRILREFYGISGLAASNEAPAAPRRAGINIADFL